jgi:hypothetical protein
MWTHPPQKYFFLTNITTAGRKIKDMEEKGETKRRGRK